MKCKRCLEPIDKQLFSAPPGLDLCGPCWLQNKPGPLDSAEFDRIARETDENKEALMRLDTLCSPRWDAKSAPRLTVPFKARLGTPYREGLVRDGRVIGYRELVDGAWVYHLDKGEEPYAETLR